MEKEAISYLNITFQNKSLNADKMMEEKCCRDNVVWSNRTPAAVSYILVLEDLCIHSVYSQKYKALGKEADNYAYFSS